MNKFFKATMLAAAFALAACGGQASAQTIPGLYKSQSGILTASLDDFNRVQCTTSAVYIWSPNLRMTNLDDAGGALCTKVMAVIAASGKGIQVGTSGVWLNTAQIGQSECTGGGTRIRWKFYSDTNFQETFADGCSVAYALVARAN